MKKLTLNVHNEDHLPFLDVIFRKNDASFRTSVLKNQYKLIDILISMLIIQIPLKGALKQ